ncbi:peptidoglycan-binding domain-containing protein [Granulicella arctica]|uniref:peptidoglycan-binding domain-containing protein n=1 Tax=Granulicella arctica TaxID=940613 RepID=UPI0021DFC9E3|nr:peptidoglycan-binding domain-containing protein [Granulicella arctica]
MRFGRILLSSSLIVASAVPALAMTHSRRGPTSPKLFNKHTAKVAHSNSQRAIDDSRATAIQTALISHGYLSGEATGHWDNQTEAAMQKMQADNGWQTKLIPDSRAIIKLGLGPNQEAEASSTGGEISTR